MTKEQQEIQEVINTLRDNAFKRLPLWARLNYMRIQISNALNDGCAEGDINWEYINKLCSEDLDVFDCNMYKPVDNVEDFDIQRNDIIAASCGLGAWHKHICKDCGNEFYMDYKEVCFYKDKGLQLPKRCKKCREQRKGGTK